MFRETREGEGGEVEDIEGGPKIFRHPKGRAPSPLVMLNELSVRLNFRYTVRYTLGQEIIPALRQKSFLVQTSLKKRESIVKITSDPKTIFCPVTTTYIIIGN